MRFVAFVVLALGCSDASPRTDPRQDVVTQVHALVLAELDALNQHALEMQAAAPRHAWDKTTDASALETMQIAWLAARDACERIEGVIAPVFPDLDAAIDQRYEGFLETGKTDDDLFDDQGMTGLHAVERILFVNTTPASVVEIERALPGYQPAAWPANTAEATALEDRLLTRLVNDTRRLRDLWQPAKIDVGTAYQGLVELVDSQREKLVEAAEGHEESRYAQRTMRDLRQNLAGAKKLHALFRPWLRQKDPSVDDAIAAGFARLDAAYAAISGDALPLPPMGFSVAKPTEADLATPFGRLWTAVHEESDPSKAGSLLERMTAAAKLLGFPVFL